jgi:hypothetical protein
MRFMWLLPILLAACSSGGPNSSADAQCERQAYSDPAVRAMIGDSAGNYMQGGPQRDQLMWAVGQAKQRCLQGKGLMPHGGVQAVQPYQ